MNEELRTSKEIVWLPCPFCGSQPKHHSYISASGSRAYAWVKCEPCGLRKELNCEGSDDASKRFVLGAVAAWWNQRPAPETCEQCPSCGYPGPPLGSDPGIDAPSELKALCEHGNGPTCGECASLKANSATEVKS